MEPADRASHSQRDTVCSSHTQFHVLWCTFMGLLFLVLYFACDNSATAPSAVPLKLYHSITGGTQRPGGADASKIESKLDYIWRNFEPNSCAKYVDQLTTLQPVMLGTNDVFSNVRSRELHNGVSLNYSIITLLFHGCNTGKEYWGRGVAERLSTRELFEQKAAVFAFTSANKRGCWRRDEEPSNLDITMVVDVLRSLVTANPAFGRLPVTGVGVSGGATLLSLLATVINMQAIALVVQDAHPVMISSIVNGTKSSVWFRNTAGLPRIWRRVTTPRLVYLYMPKDSRIGALVHDQTQQLAQLGTVQLHVLQAGWFPVKTSIFHDYMPTRFTPAESVELFYDVAPLLNYDVKAKNLTRHDYSSFEVMTGPSIFLPEYIASLTRLVAARYQANLNTSMDTLPGHCCDVLPDGSLAANGLCRMSDFHTFDAYANPDINTSKDIYSALASSQEMEDLAVVVKKLLKIAYGVHEMTWEHRKEVVGLLRAPR